jgi:hypothetical protein
MARTDQNPFGMNSIQDHTPFARTRKPIKCRTPFAQTGKGTGHLAEFVPIKTPMTWTLQYKRTQVKRTQTESRDV